MTDPHLVTTTLLLKRLLDRSDEDAWRQFDARFRGVVLATGLRLGLDREDAEEVAQETMLQAFRDYQGGRYDRTRGRLSSWIISIAHHRIIDLRRRAHDGVAGLTGVEIDEPTIADAFERALQKKVFEDAWRMVRSEGQSSASTLDAFELTALRGVPAKQAAIQCGISVDQVYVARNRVARRLEDIISRIDHAVRDGL